MCSSILCIDLFNNPNSITWSHIFAINLPSDVPPSVETEASWPIISLMDDWHFSKKSFFVVKYGSPE